MLQWFIAKRKTNAISVTYILLSQQNVGGLAGGMGGWLLGCCCCCCCFLLEPKSSKKRKKFSTPVHKE